jgi:cytochrome c-type biogenesis protein
MPLPLADASFAAQIPLAFAFGLLSVLTPCVLPLVPGYLSTVSAVEADRLGEPGVARRVLLGSLPFMLGFTVVFVALGAGAAGIGSVLSPARRAEIAGLILVVFGLAFMGLLPMPKQLVAPGLVASARRRGSFALGAAFSVCAAPCIGPILGSALALASRRSTVAQGSLLLLVYSAGLGVAFVLAAVAFTRAMGTFRWLRDRYVVMQLGSGVLLVGLGLLLFFHRDWWLRIAFNRVLDWLHLPQI